MNASYSVLVVLWATLCMGFFGLTRVLMYVVEVAMVLIPSVIQH